MPVQQPAGPGLLLAAAARPPAAAAASVLQASPMAAAEAARARAMDSYEHAPPEDIMPPKRRRNPWVLVGERQQPAQAWPSQRCCRCPCQRLVAPHPLPAGATPPEANALLRSIQPPGACCCCRRSRTAAHPRHRRVLPARPTPQAPRPQAACCWADSSPSKTERARWHSTLCARAWCRRA